MKKQRFTITLMTEEAMPEVNSLRIKDALQSSSNFSDNNTLLSVGDVEEPEYKQPEEELETYVILDWRGARHGTIKATSRTEALNTYFGFKAAPESLCSHFALLEQDLKAFKANVKNL